MTTQRWKPAIVITLVWVAYYLVSIVQSMTVQRQLGGTVPLSSIALRLVPTIGFWALLTPLLIWLARRFRVEHHVWRRNLAIHLGVAIAISCLDHWVWLRWREIMHLHNPAAPQRSFLAGWLTMIDLYVFTYLVIIATVHAIDYYRWFHQRREQARELGVRAYQLEGQLANARLQLLKMQLQPHFLFNTLHAIAELVHREPKVADRMLTGLGDLLRRSLDHDGRQLVELREELALLEAYCAIEMSRFRDRLRIVYAIEPDTLDVLVPHLLLQPLVENAICHGIARRLGPGCVRIAARKLGQRVEIRVEDDGVGLPPGKLVREGVGVRNTRSRLEQLYRGDYRFELTGRDEGGLVAWLDLPYQTGLGAEGREPVELLMKA